MMGKNFEKIFEILPDGWLTKPEAECLWKWVNQTTDSILEVGCYLGRSTVLLASTGRRVITVDPFYGFLSSDPKGTSIRNSFLQNIQDRNLPNVELFSRRVEEWNPYEETRIKFAYLDGDHTYQGTVNQINKALSCGADIIAIHDVNDSGGGKAVKEAAIEKLGNGWVDRVERLCVWRIE
jgi:hypothetical protein